MSGIYIPGMEMPQTGCYFICVDNSKGKDKTMITVERMLGNRDVRLNVGSFELVPVPPHGDLIDRQALLADTTDMLHSMMVFGGARVYTSDAIKNAPTIIPAEEEQI